MAYPEGLSHLNLAPIKDSEEYLQGIEYPPLERIPDDAWVNVVQMDCGVSLLPLPASLRTLLLVIFKVAWHSPKCRGNAEVDAINIVELAHEGLELRRENQGSSSGGKRTRAVPIRP